jgi:tRNA1Val (adenine37-N6)-methyltransferase
MANDYFTFKEFTIKQERAAFKVGTDSVLLGACSNLSGAAKILDIGTGTGLIAIMAAQRSDAVITAIEPDKDSFSQALENVGECKWAERITVINSDLRSFTSENEQKFDSILSNPPYFRDSLRNPDERTSSARHTFSLSSDDILTVGSGLLTEEGSLQIILPYEEGNLFIAEAVGYGLFCTGIIKVKPNPSGKIIRQIMKFEKTKKKVHEKFLTIETGVRHQYTDEYMELTKEFYLFV